MKGPAFAFALLFWMGGSSPLSAEPAPSEYCVTAVAGEEAPVKSTSGLAWDKSKVEVSSRFGESIVRTSYRFANIGKAPVSIVGITPSCGCVSTQLDKLDFAPGETGEMKVTLDLAMDNAVGLQERFIVVTASDAPKTPSMLRLVVHVPTPVETSAKDVTWKVGDALVAKEIIISPGPGVADLKVKSESNNADFSVTIKPDADGRRYHVCIAPASTAALCYAQIHLEAEAAIFGHPIICNINANVN